MITNILKKYYPIFSILTVLCAFGAIFSTNGIFPFGDLTIAWCDACQQTIPLLCDLKDVLLGKSNLWLSLENAGGMNFYGVYFFNLSSPFTYLILFFEKSQLSVAFNLMVALKLATAACTFGFWLKREIPNANPIVVLSVSFAYAFSGWAMMYYQILSWLDTLYVFPLLLIGLKNLGEGKSPLLYIISLFLCILFHFYLGWAIVIFVCLYGLIHVILNKNDCKAFCKNFIISSAISALLSAIVILPCFMQYLQSMRSGDMFEDLASKGFFPRLDTALPTFFSVFMLAPFMVRGLKDKQFNTLEILFLLMLVPMFIEPVSAAWQTYDYMSFPTRYGFITIALGFTLSVKGLTDLTTQPEDEETNKTKLIKLLVSALALTLVTAFGIFSSSYFTENEATLTKYSSSLWGNTASLEALFTYYFIPFVLMIGIYLALHYKIVHKIAVYALIAVLCVVEGTFSANVYMVAPANTNDKFTRALELENLIEDEEFYRLKLNEKSLDVNLVGAMGYNSLSHYTSLTRASFMMTLKQLGYSSYWMETASNGGTVFTDALVRHKYIATRGKGNGEYVTKNFYITKNDILFPTAFAIETEGQNDANLNLERWEIQNELFKRLTGCNGIYEEYDYSDLYNLNDVSNTDRARAKTHFTLSQGASQGQLVYEIQVDGTKNLYFDCFDLYSNNLKEHTYNAISQISVSALGKRVTYRTYPTQSANGTLSLGKFTDTIVTIKVTLASEIYAQSYGLFSVDEISLKNAINGLIGGDFKVDKDVLSGKITAKDGQSLFTSFAYDEGYIAKVNGKTAKTFEINGFLAIELEKGENTVELGFLPKGLWLGLLGLALGVIALILYLKFYDKIQNFEKLDGTSVILVSTLGIVVFIAIYLMPIFVNILL